MSYLEGLTNLLFTAIITLKKRSDSSTITIRLTSQELPNLEYSSDVYLPLLKEVSNLSEEHDLFLPRSSEGTLTIDNSEGSFGYNRKFSDILDWYAVVEQDIIIEVRKIRDNFSTFNVASQSWAFRCASVDSDPERGEIKLKLRNNAIPDRVFTKEINSNDFPSAPSFSLGKYLPLVIGNDVNVQLQYIGNNNFASMTIPDGYTFDAFNNYYYFDSVLARWMPFNLTGNVATYKIQNTGRANDVQTDLNNGIVFGLYVDEFVDGGNYLIDRIELNLRGVVGSASSGIITCEIGYTTYNEFEFDYVAGIANNELKILGSANIKKQDKSSSYNTASDFWETFQFIEPIRIGQDEILPGAFGLPLTRYLIIIKDDSSSGSPVRYLAKNYVPVQWNLGTAGYSATTRKPIAFRMRGITATNTTSSADTNGLRYTYTTFAGGSSKIDLTKLQTLANINGLKIGSDLKNTPAKLMPLLLGSSLYDDTSLSSTHTAYANRVLSGQTTGKTTRLGLLPTLMKNSASRLISTASKGSVKLALYAYGTSVASSHVLKQDRIKSLKYKIGNRTTVINNITANYKKDILLFSALDIETQRQSAGYSRTLGNQRLSGSQSITLYGQNDLANSGFEFVGTDPTMLNIIDYYLTDKEHPEVSVEIAINYDPADPINEMLASEKLTLITPKLPNFLGTNPKLENIYTEDFEIVTENNFSTPVIARNYICELKSKKLQFRRGRTELVLDLRLCNI